MIMMRTFCCILLFMASLSYSTAQNAAQIRRDTTLLYGEGSGRTIKKADDHAIDTMIDKMPSLSAFQSSIATKSRRVVMGNEPNVQVIRYIKKSDVSSIFDARKDKITELLSFAESSQAKLQIGDALRYYYWADMLFRSLPSPSELTYKDRIGKTHIVAEWLPEKINSVFNGISAKYNTDNQYDKNLIEVSFLYGGLPVRNIDYTFFNGRDWSEVYSAKDGVGIIERVSFPDLG